MIQSIRLVLAVALATLPTAGVLAAEQGSNTAEKRVALGSIDTNQDGRVSLEEFKAGAMKRVERQFQWMDANGDKYIDRSELETVIQQLHERGGAPQSIE